MLHDLLEMQDFHRSSITVHH